MMFRLTSRLAALTCAALFASALAAAPSALAATSCNYEGAAEVLEVTMSADNDSAILKVVGGEIKVNSASAGPLSCTNGPPTLANTEYVNVFDNSSGGSTFVSLLEPGAFAGPGGAGINLAFGSGGADRLYLGGSTGPDHWVIGKNGVDSDGNGSKDVSFVSPPDVLIAGAGEGEDVLDAQGSPSTGAAVSEIFLSLSGDTGNDTIQGGEGGDALQGGDGNDVIRGFGGNDSISGDALQPGNDTIEGGEGSDSLSFPLAQKGVAIDLGDPAPQATGDGTDTIREVENVEGTEFDDSLTGNASVNNLQGNGGDDAIEGEGGNDILGGGSGTDTLGFEHSPAGVTVDLGAQMVSGGEGDDAISEFENVVGSEFDDALRGSAGANSIWALGGADSVDSRDGSADKVSCGAGFDSAVTDSLTVDSVFADCERVDSGLEPVRTSPPPISTTPPDTSLLFRLGGPHRQRLARKPLLVKIACPEEACTVVLVPSGTGSTKRMTERLRGGASKTIRIGITRARRRAIERALASGRTPKAKVRATARDAAGNVAHATLTVRAKR